MPDPGQVEGGRDPETTIPRERVSWLSRLRAARAAGAAAVAGAQRSAPGAYWSRLTALDFINSSFAFSALAVLCGFPFLAVVSAAVGGDFRHAIIARMGLSPEAARDVNGLIAAGHHAIGTLTLFSAVLLVVGALGMASTLQAWYQKIYDQPPSPGTLRRLGYQAAGIAAFSVYISVQVVVLRAIKHASGSALGFAWLFVSAALFWWCSAYFLLSRRVGWRKLLPAGVATGFCITGLGVFSSLLFSDQITSGEKSYGPAGVVLAIIEYLVGFGVCLFLGAVFGRLWNEWRTGGAAAHNGVASVHNEAPETDGELR